ncbi:MAG TPA: hypothetical protein DHW02_01625 [Ktedonobacter sp.]|nr:hypothetical protein [Ktedonobacter sp.]
MPPILKRDVLVDENMSRTLVSALQTRGHSAEHVHEIGLNGHPDSEVFAYALAHKKIIITIDLDFSNIIQYPPPHFGIIVLRIPDSVPVTDRIEEILKSVDQLKDSDLANTIVIVEQGRMRIRKL